MRKTTSMAVALLTVSPLAAMAQEVSVNFDKTKTKTLLFRGTATDDLADKAEKNEKKIDQAVSKIFKNFPPGSKK